MPKTERKQDGTQAIRRAAALLKAVAHNGSQGVKLRDLTESSGLTRSTAHRILKALLDEQLLEYDDRTRRYAIGPLAFELSLSTGRRDREIMRWAPVIDDFRNRTGATTYLMGRSGYESVCLHKAEGTSVLRAIPVELGQRRPLGVGAGATALLSACPDAVIDETLATIAPYLSEYPNLSEERIRANIARARQTGFAESVSLVVDGVYGLAMSLPDAGMSPGLAISTAVHLPIATEDRIATWKRLMASLCNTAQKTSAVSR